MDTRSWVIYHKDCADGFGAAWAAHTVLGPRAIYVAAKYGDALPSFAEGDSVWVLDFSYGREDVERIAAECRLTLLDHHATAAAELEGVHSCHFDMTHSGAVLAWHHFHPGEPTPELLSYVEDRDLWRWELPDSEAVNAAVAELPKEFSAWDEASRDIEGLRRNGEAILERNRRQVAEQVEQAHPVNVTGYDTLGVMAEQLRSETASLMLEQHPELEFVVVYFGDTIDGDDVLQVSLRSREGFDVSKIAQQFGGGGHPQAAGFRLSLRAFDSKFKFN